MANKIVLGKTPEEIRAEEAAKQRELEAEILEARTERQAKIAALYRKQKQNTIIVISVSILLIISLLVFGTYNTFFKHQFDENDAIPLIEQSVGKFNYPVEGLTGYIRDNSDILFEKYLATNKNQNIKSISVDKNSFAINRVYKISSGLSLVYFSIDVNLIENDTQVTDSELIRNLIRAGLTTSKTVEYDNKETSDIAKKITYKSEDSIDNYYITTNGTIMKSGKSTTQRYLFHIPIEIDVKKRLNDTTGEEEIIGYGYKPADNMTLCVSEFPNTTDFDEIMPSEFFSINEENLCDEKTTELMQKKVNDILISLYNGNSDNLDYTGKLKFNGYDSKFEAITSFQPYTVTNEAGYNTHIVYKITTSQGFSYNIDTWLLVTQVGEGAAKTYIIEKMQ